MPLRIAFDMDGVLANMDAAIDRVAQTLFDETPGRDPVVEDPSHAETRSEDDLSSRLELVELTPRQQRQLAKHISGVPNFWETLDEIESGATAQLARLVSERRWEVIFLTKRPVTAGETAQLQTQRWLQRHGFAIPSVFVVSGSRGQIANALSLDYVVDDRPENCLDVVLESRAKAILIWRQTAAEVPAKARRLGIAVTTSVVECLDLLSRIDELHDKPGMLSRIKRLLGIERELLSV